MDSQRTNHCRAAPRRRLTLIVCCVLFCKVFSAYCQAQQSPTALAAGPDQLTNAIDEVKAGNWAEVSSIVHEAGAAKALPILKDLFLSSKDDETKEQIASTVMELGDTGEIYWNFLSMQANEAIDSDPPYPIFLGKDDKGVANFSPAFEAWAKAHNMTTSEAWHEATYVLPGHLLLLGVTHDTRAIPVLQRGLLKAHGSTQVSAANALAMLQDSDSIPLIVDACKNAPPEIASTIAFFALVSFDDPRAQSAAGIYLTKEMINTFEGKKLYRGPFPPREY